MTGEPSWMEIGVSDVAQARRFWGQLLAWQFQDMPGENASFETPTVPGGVHGDDPSGGLTVYFAVPDIDAAVKRVRELGGTAEDPSPDQAGFGRFASCADDQGVRFGLRQAPSD